MKKVETGKFIHKNTEWLLRFAALLLSVYVVFSLSRSTVVDLVNKSFRIRELTNGLQVCEVELVKARVKSEKSKSEKKEADVK